MLFPMLLLFWVINTFMVSNGKVVYSDNTCYEQFHIDKELIINVHGSILICQKIIEHPDVLYFSNYDQVNNITLYSAYNLLGGKELRNSIAWKIEPQICEYVYHYKCLSFSNVM